MATVNDVRQRNHGISLVAEIERVDAIANTVFEVCIGIAVGALALAFSVDAEAARIATLTIGVSVALLAVSVVPDVVFAQRQPDRSDASLRKYLKFRQRQTQGAVLVLLALAMLGLDVGLAALIADLADDPVGGVVAGISGLICGLVGSYSERDELWPSALRGHD